MNRKYMMDRMADMQVQVAAMQKNIDTMQQMITLMEQMNGVMKSMVARTHNMADDIAELRDHISDFDDFLRPMRNCFYWEPHCYEHPGVPGGPVHVRQPRRHRHHDRRLPEHPAGHGQDERSCCRRCWP